MSNFSDPIYKRDSHGNVRQWFYEVERNRYRTHSGIKDGTMVSSAWTTCVAKSQDTDDEQAKFEAEALRRHKLERTYHTSLRNIDNPIIFSPMLAKEYTREQKKIQFPVLSQPKLDGIRCVATAKGFFTRQGKPITAVPHLEDELEEFFQQFPDAIIDGELYNHELKEDFNTIASVVRRQSNSDDDIARSRKLIQYHVYDTYDETADWQTRSTAIYDWYDDSTVIIPVETEVVFDQAKLDELYDKYMEAGYEGQMVRRAGSYENKRSSLLLKRKEFQDAEFTIVDIQSGLGNWEGYGKKLVLSLPDGRTFGAGVRGTQEFTKKILEDRESYIGGKATIRFFNLTPDGIPRFPVATDIRKGEKVD